MTLTEIQELDRNDSLANKRDLFDLPAGVIYLDGNSLGALPLTARERAVTVTQQQWGQDLIQSWNTHDWIDLPLTVGEKIAPLLGAAPGQTICCDSTSVNLFKLLCCALRMQEGRNIVLTQTSNFPADLYIAEGVADYFGGERCEVRAVEESDIEAQLSTEVAVLMLTQVDFKTAAVHDIERLTRLAQGQGILVIWDLAHSVGALPLALDDWRVDFAVGCGYKYLNGGPGAPAFIYAAQRHHSAIRQPLSGWMGHKTPFSFAPGYEAAPGVQQFLCGTPGILSMSVLDAALDAFHNIDMHLLRQKSVALGELFQRLLTENNACSELVLVSPVDASKRGSHLAYAHPNAYSICQALIAHNVVADYRAPNILRLGFAALYLSYRNAWDAVEVLRKIMVSGEYLQPRFAIKQKVT